MVRVLAIPTIGEVLIVARDWSFTCIAEYRNISLMDYLVDSGVIETNSPRFDPATREYLRYMCTIPAGTKLRVDRIYIRKGKSEYDSITFWAIGLSKKRVRFFARLADVNQMMVTDTEVEVSAAPKPLRAILLRD